MFGEYIISYFQNLLLGSQKLVKVPLLLIVFFSLIISSLFLFEFYLSEYCFLYLQKDYGYDEALSALVTSGLFLLQGMLFLLSIKLCFKKDLVSGFGIENQPHMLKKAISAFLKGYHGTSRYF